MERKPEEVECPSCGAKAAHKCKSYAGRNCAAHAARVNLVNPARQARPARRRIPRLKQGLLFEDTGGE